MPQTVSRFSRSWRSPGSCPGPCRWWQTPARLVRRSRPFGQSGPRSPPEGPKASRPMPCLLVFLATSLKHWSEYTSEEPYFEKIWKTSAHFTDGNRLFFGSAENCGCLGPCTQHTTRCPICMLLLGFSQNEMGFSHTEHQIERNCPCPEHVHTAEDLNLKGFEIPPTRSRGVLSVT